MSAHQGQSLRPRVRVIVSSVLTGSWKGKAKILELSFDKAEMDIVGIQEGRAKVSSVVSGIH